MAAPVILTLGHAYPADLWDLRKAVTAARAGGPAVVTVALRSPINAPEVEVALLAGSLYLVGVRGSGRQWYEFAADAEQPGSSIAAPLLPGSRPVMVGAARALSTYRALRLGHMIETNGGAVSLSVRPPELLAWFSTWTGALNVDLDRLRMCALIFLVCEALRFRSIEEACYGYVWTRGWRAFRIAAEAAGQPIADVRTQPPDTSGHLWPVLTITRDMLETVQNWQSRAAGGDPDVWTPLPGMPDTLIR